MDNEKNTKKKFEKLIKDQQKQRYVLKLYIAGLSPKSTKAVESIKKICETHIKGHYDLEVIDMYSNPSLAKEGQIIAVPTLVKKLPLPLRKIIGDMTKEEKLLVGLDLKEI